MKHITCLHCGDTYPDFDVAHVCSSGQYAISKEQFDILLTRANIELVQRVNRMIELLEKQYGVKEKSITIGSRIKVISGFNVGAKGTVSYIEPSGKLWVRRDGASSDVFYHSEEVIGVEHD